MADLIDLGLVFGPDYLRFYGPALTDERSDQEARTVWELGGLEPGARVLDAPCGHGRIANRLAGLGAAVTGLDITPAFLDQARRDAAERRLQVEYVEGDLRRMPFRHAFQVAVSWFTSFGYWEDDGCRAVLEGYARALEPGGLLLLEMQNRDRLLRHLLPTTVQQAGDDFMIDRHTFDPAANRIHTDRTFVVGGERRHTEYAIRLFTATELAGWLRDAGFADVGVVDDTGAALELDSRRMVARARTPHA
jgi:SAM-dependent methyltransferase